MNIGTDADSGYLPDHHLEPAVQFDFGAIDRMAGFNEPRSPHDEDVADAADALRSIMKWVCFTPKGKRRPWKSAFRHFISMTAVLRPEIFNGMPIYKVGRKMGLSAFTLSSYSTDFQNNFKIHLRVKNGHGASSKR